MRVGTSIEGRAGAPFECARADFAFNDPHAALGDE